MPHVLKLKPLLAMMNYLKELCSASTLTNKEGINKGDHFHRFTQHSAFLVTLTFEGIVTMADIITFHVLTSSAIDTWFTITYISEDFTSLAAVTYRV
ncbi:hypothetical protein PoB_002080200 [Plakobranchus ocellatus]|uniref:Uncharacterized protein n=1 Tax=Plakobranchus ocellatus TaxID=259542 RepID=A0AAV3ZID1_9GAST|nr:hypothetical protein PoB_002080200 [Plakobranchus ocellatus]